MRVKCSPLRAVENFLDIAHFPFVHTDILGAEPHTEVQKYEVEIREKEDEVWATQVKFYQPQAAKSAAAALPPIICIGFQRPTCSVLYKTCPARPGEWDVITLFVQPLTEELCDVWPWMALFDDTTPMTDLIHFQQMIFLQDRSILENQLPRLLPLDPGMEIPTRADLTSVAYRRWLKRHNYTYWRATGGAMKLYDYILSPSCYKIRLLAALLGIKLDLRSVDFHPGREHLKPQLLALNPRAPFPFWKMANSF